MQAMTANTVIAYITHDERPDISPASSSMERSDIAACELRKVHNNQSLQAATALRAVPA